MCNRKTEALSKMALTTTLSSKIDELWEGLGEASGERLPGNAHAQ